MYKYVLVLEEKVGRLEQFRPVGFPLKDVICDTETCWWKTFSHCLWTDACNIGWYHSVRQQNVGRND